MPTSLRLKTLVAGLSLGRYVEELVTSMVEAAGTLKPSAVGVAAAVCSLLHQQYDGFGRALAPALAAAASGAGQVEEAEAKKRRAALRLLGELYLQVGG